ncbi:MAG: TolC family protein, partial [Muribaculaceae bacterium]|nr:TolC family protein [Muribaculaceae bacterium]
MKHTSTILTIILLLFPLQGLLAQKQQGETPMTLHDCLLYAREHAHINRINRLETEAAAADKRISAADLLPYIGLGSNGSLSFGRNIDPETNTYDNKKTLGTGFGLEMSLPLFDGLVRINNLKALKAAEIRKKKAQLVEEDRVSLEVIKDFYNISYCTSMVEQMQRQLQRDSTDLEAARHSHKLGTKSGADVAELEAIVAADLYEMINQKNLLKKARLSLRTAMGMPLTDTVINIVVDFNNFPCSEYTRILPEIEEAEMAVKEGEMYLRAAKGG